MVETYGAEIDVAATRTDKDEPRVGGSCADNSLGVGRYLAERAPHPLYKYIQIEISHCEALTHEH